MSRVHLIFIRCLKSLSAPTPLSFLFPQTLATPPTDKDMASSSGPSASGNNNLSAEVNVSSTDVERIIASGNYMRQLGRLEEAKAQFDVALMLEPTSVALHESRLDFFLSMGVIDLAVDELNFVRKDIMEERKSRIFVVKRFLDRIMECRLSKNWVAALVEVDGAIEAGVNCSQVILAFKAEILLWTSKFAEAQQIFRRADFMGEVPITDFEIFGMPAKAYMRLIAARLQLCVGPMANVNVEARSALKAGPGIGEVAEFVRTVETVITFYQNGNNFFKKGDYVAAEREYKAALHSSKVKSLTLINCWASCHMKSGNWRKCLTLAELALQIEPNNEKSMSLRKTASEKMADADGGAD